MSNIKVGVFFRHLKQPIHAITNSSDHDNLT